jgi:hypothetical protein
MTSAADQLLAVLEEIQPSLVALAALSLLSLAIGFVSALAINITKIFTVAAWRNVAMLSLLTLGVGVLGAAAGLAGGQSRTGVVGEIIPAAFVLLGGVSAYLFGVTPQRAPVVALTTIGFAVTLFAGFHSGSWRRTYVEEERELRTVCIKAMTDGAFVAQTAAFQRFWAAMETRKTASAIPADENAAQGKQQVYELRSNLCADVVQRWTLVANFPKGSMPKPVSEIQTGQADTGEGVVGSFSSTDTLLSKEDSVTLK